MQTVCTLSQALDGLTNHFLLDCDSDGGALYQKLKHAQVLALERTANQLEDSSDQNEETSSHLKTLEENCKSRLSKLHANPAPLNQTDWTKEIDKTKHTLIVYLDLLKPNNNTGKQQNQTKIPTTSIQELLSSSYSPVTDERIKLWLSYPGVLMAVKRAQEIDDLASKLQPPTLDPNILATLLQTCAIAFT